MPRSAHRVIVIGTSAGGSEALDDLIGQLPSDIPASIFIVQHVAAEASADALLDRLCRHKYGERFKPGTV